MILHFTDSPEGLGAVVAVALGLGAVVFVAFGLGAVVFVAFGLGLGEGVFVFLGFVSLVRDFFT